MTKIEVANDGAFKINGAKSDVQALTQDFLEHLVEDALNGNVEFSIEGTHPIANFFNTIQKETSPESDLAKLKAEMLKSGPEEACAAEIDDGQNALSDKQ